MRVILLCFVLLPFCAVVKAAEFLLPVQFVIINGDYDGSLVVLKKNGQSVFTIPGEKNMQLKLGYNEDYLVSFSKPGYITKQISVNTNVPDERIAAGFYPYKIGVRLFKQYEGINTVVYNQPVASIRFLASIDDFGYDTDYTKSILSTLTETENLLSIISEQERNSNKNSSRHSRTQDDRYNDYDNIININKKEAGSKHVSASGEASSERVNNESKGIDQEKDLNSSTNTNDIQKITPSGGKSDPAGNNYSGGEDAKAGTQGKGGEDQLKKESFTGSGMDVHQQESLKKEASDKSEEEIYEPHRKITKVTVTKNGARTIFHKVQYLNGECYYFMNGSKAISPHLYEYFTRE